jgi:hypothetical protein
MWHSVGLPNAVHVVSSQAWPVATTGHVEVAHSLPVVGSLTLGLCFPICSVGDNAGPHEACAPAQH